MREMICVNGIAFESIPEVATIIFSSNFMFDLDTEVSRLGLHGLWQTEDNRQAGTILVGLGRITEEAFQRAIEERDKAVKLKETIHGCAICGGLFPESKCVKAKMNQSEGWVCITDFERLEAEL